MGVVLTVMVTESVAEPQPDIVTVYVVVTVGLATGLAILGLLRPAAGDHEYDEPPEAESVVLLPAQIAVGALTETVPDPIIT